MTHTILACRPSTGRPGSGRVTFNNTFAVGPTATLSRSMGATDSQDVLVFLTFELTERR
jgi:hypothetical protein